jgi:hypothetical protein
MAQAEKPNTTNPSRRAVIAGGAAVSALAIVPAQAVPTLSNSDAELLALGNKLDDAHARVLAAEIPLHETSKRYERMKPQKPALLKPPAKYAELWKTISVGQMEMLPDDHPLIVWVRDTEELRGSIFTAHFRECKRIGEQCGVDAAESAYNDRLNELWEIGNKIYAMRAHSLAGLMVKLRTVEALADEDLGDAWESVGADIRVLANGAAALRQLDAAAPAA